MLDFIPTDILGLICVKLSIRELNILWAVGNAKLNSNLHRTVLEVDDRNDISSAFFDWSGQINPESKFLETNDHCFPVIARRFPRIRSIRIRSARYLGDNCGIEQFTQLRSLYLKHVNLFTDVFIQRIPRSVTSLSIKWSPLITSDSYVNLPPDLTKLTLRHLKYTFNSAKFLPKSITSLNIPAKRIKLKSKLKNTV